MTGKLLNDCFGHGAKRMTHTDALALLRTRIARVVEPERLPLAAASGRILAEAVTAPRDIPAYDYSAMDGYAFAHAGYDAADGTWFALAGRAAAGHAFDRAAGQGEALRILTGAPIPEGTDTVAMQEDVRVEVSAGGTRIFVPGGLAAHANRRLAGEDMAAGTIVAAPGLRLRPQDIAVIAATGTGEIACYRRLRIAVISTGDEIVRAGTPLGRAQIYDANGPMLAALARLAGAEVTDLGVLPDRAELLRDTLADAATWFDAIVTSGGASHGDEDHVAATVQALGSLHLWELAIKPGKPLSLGQIGNCAFIGLPGNPVAAFACFLLYAVPVLTALGGGTWREPRRFALPSAFALAKRKTGRREFLRGLLVAGADGRLAVDRFQRDGSGLISSLQASEGLIELAEDVAGVALGEPLNFIPYAEFGILP